MIFKYVFLSLVVSSCVQKEGFSISEKICEDMETNATFENVQALFNGEIIQIQEDFVIEGFVTSSDESGNFFGELFIQNTVENPTSAFRIAIDLRVSHLFYPIGSKLFIHTKGLYLDKRDGAYELGGLFNGFGNLSIGRLPFSKIQSHLFASCDPLMEIIPQHVDLKSIDEKLLNTLVRIDNVEITPSDLCETFAVPQEQTQRMLVNCEGNTVALTTSGFSDFKDLILPTGNGTLTGILTGSENNYEIIARNANDLNLENVRCDNFTFSCTPPDSNRTINEIKNQYNGSPILIENSDVITGVIVANDVEGNLSRAVYVQDDSGGIRLNLNANDLNEKGYEIGRILTLNTSGLVLDAINGELQLGVINVDNFEGIPEMNFFRHIYLLDESRIIAPETLTILSLTTEKVGQFISISSVQFINPEGKTFIDGNQNTLQIVSDCETNRIVLPIDRGSDFANELLPQGNGNITGILIKNNEEFQLLIRGIDDTSQMVNAPCELPEILTTSDKVFFSELADPENNTGARFIELFNNDSLEVDLSGWKIRRYTNANTTISSEITFPKLILPPKGTVVIAANAIEFEKVYGFPPDITGSGNGPADSNGDDNLELVDSSGKLIDIFGIIGEDGSGTNHEFEDGRAVRLMSVIQGNPVFNALEWIIYNDTGAAGTINQPQQAPEDYNPGER